MVAVVVVVAVAVGEVMSSIQTVSRSAIGESTTNIASLVALTFTVTDEVSASSGADDEQTTIPQPLTTTGRVVVIIWRNDGVSYSGLTIIFILRSLNILAPHSPGITDGVGEA